MHPLYEEAARALLFMERVGLEIGKYTWVDLLYSFANLLGRLNTDAKGLSHVGAATWILDHLESRKLVTCASARRTKVLAVLGTVIGNLCGEGRR